MRFQFLTLFLFCLLSPNLLADDNTLTSVKDIVNISDEDCKRPHSFDLTGELLLKGDLYWFFRDETGGVEIHNLVRETMPFERGDVIRVKGELTLKENGIRRLYARSIALLAHGQPSPPVAASAEDVQSGRTDFRFVRMTGVISSVVKDEIDEDFLWATLRTSSGKTLLAFDSRGHDRSRLVSLIDAEVSVTGLATPITGFRNNLGKNIRISAADTVSVIKRPSVSPLDAPLYSNASVPHRQRLSGTVLAIEPQRFFIRTAVNRLISVYPSADSSTPRVSPGDLVILAGFASEVPYHLQLSNAIVLRNGKSANLVEQASKRTVRSLFVDEQGRDNINSHADGTIVTLEGYTRNISPEELLLTDGSHSISINARALRLLGIVPPEHNSRISVSGLCLAEFENPPTPMIYPVFKRFVAIPRSAADITVLSRPPWWTPFRLLVLVLVLTAVIAAILAWNVALKRKSERRGKELYEERLSHALAEQKVEERTRLAVELHDSISQSLTGVALQLDGGKTETAKSMLSACRGELRRCLWDLRSRTFEEKDMTEAVTRTIAPHLNGCAATVRFNVPRDRLSESVTHAILRIVRELVVNAIRHGQAKHIRVAGEFHDDTISFSVKDDGVGFDPGTAPGPEEGHFGLLGIRERLEDFDGELTVESAPGQGARFAVTLNMRENDNGK